MPSPLLTEVDDALLHASEMELYEALPDQQRDKLWKEYFASLDDEERESMAWSVVFYEKLGTATKTLREREKFEAFLRRKDLLNTQPWRDMIIMAYEARYSED